MHHHQDLQYGNSMRQFPVQNHNRHCTDVVCAIIGIAFTVVLIAFAFFIYNEEHYVKSGFPTDSDGRVCGIDTVSFPYVYFSQLPDKNKRLCVSQCPSEGDSSLSCLPTKSTGCRFNSNGKWTVNYYPNVPQATGIGYYCMPTDASIKERLLNEAQITERYQFIENIGTIAVSVLVALGLSIGFFFLVQLFSNQMNHLTLVFGLIIMLFSISFLAFYAIGYTVTRWICIVLLLFFFVATLLGIISMGPSLKFHAIFLKHSSYLVSDNWRILFLVPIFIAILVLFLILLILEVRSFWSSADMTTSEEEVYPQLKSGTTTIWTLLAAIQFLWGLCFIKQAFNFCVSQMAVEWYSNGRQPSSVSVFAPLRRAFTLNFGSIVACSFMSAFFTVLDYLFDLLRPTSLEPPTCYRSFYSFLLKNIGDFFNLVRSDSMTYINMSGNPFCNAARYCEYVNYQFELTNNNQSISRGYRVCAHMLIAGTASIFNLLLQGNMTNLLILMTVFLLSLFVSTFWISLHADACESFQIMFMMNWNFSKRRLGCDLVDTQKQRIQVFRVLENPTDLHQEIKDQYLLSKDQK